MYARGQSGILQLSAGRSGPICWVAFCQPRLRALQRSDWPSILTARVRQRDRSVAPRRCTRSCWRPARR
eukprot:4850653-Prymnesium_polylepis.1